MSLGLQQDECEGAEVLSLAPCLLLSPASVRHYGALTMWLSTPHIEREHGIMGVLYRLGSNK